MIIAIGFHANGCSHGDRSACFVPFPADDSSDGRASQVARPPDGIGEGSKDLTPFSVSRASRKTVMAILRPNALAPE